jgi:hypothetical protein
VQLQTLYDASNANTYCGRVIGNSYLDAPGSANGSLDTEIAWGATVFQTDGYTQCQVPSQCPITSQDTIRGLTGFEVGGPGHSVVLNANHPLGEANYTVYACGSYTEVGNDPNNPSSPGPNTINHTCTNWYTPPGLQTITQF